MSAGCLRCGICEATRKELLCGRGGDLLATPHAAGSLFRHDLGLRHVLVGNVHLDRARRCIGEILVAVDGAARNVDPVADLEHARRLALDGIGDLALLDRPPLLAWMAME